MKVTCVPNACFKFWYFTVNAFFFSSLVVAHVCTFPSKQRFKKFTSPAPKWSHFAKIVLLKLNFQDEGQLSANCFFYCFSHFAWNFFFFGSHCVKSVQIPSYFWSVFSCIRTEYGDWRNKSPYLPRIQENTDQK